MTTLREVLSSAEDFGSVLPHELQHGNATLIDLTDSNTHLQGLDVADTAAFSAFIDRTLREAGAALGVGGYGEDRAVYRSPLFRADGKESRSVHLAVDLWAPAGTPIYSPLEGTVHSFQNNRNPQDYGPTIILQHRLDELEFYTLYGHLSRTSLDGLQKGMNISKGMPIATLGAPDENGGWPPHLHFQVISDMLGKSGDFPGVSAPSESRYYLQLCPDPNLILRIHLLAQPK